MGRASRRYVDTITERLGLGGESLVVELASNDGYLLQHFLPKGIPVLGIDPAANVAEAARRARRADAGRVLRRRARPRESSPRAGADLVLGNNVLAQVPDLNDFVAGVASLLAPDGTATFEFPHLARLLEELQYDTIYHEHFSYFSLYSISAIFGAHGLAVVDVEELPTHGGSLRVYLRARRAGAARAVRGGRGAARRRGGARAARPRALPPVRRRRAGVEARAARVPDRAAPRRASRSSATARPGKGNTLLNYCGIRTDFLDYTVDRNPYKQGRYTPGTHIPIHPPERIAETTARCDPHPAVEPRRRDRRAAGVHGRVGRAAGDSHPDRPLPPTTPGRSDAPAADRPANQNPFGACCAIGAHSDDLEIGCGGTLLALCRAEPQVSVHWVVLAAPGERADEARASASASWPVSRIRPSRCIRSRTGICPTRLPRSRTSSRSSRTRVEPELVLTHTRDDLHQDHRLVCELTWNTFRDHLILEYEIPKWDGDVGRPNVYVPLTEELVRDKLAILSAHFDSQSGKHWFDADLFRGLMRIRGMECRAPSGFAEAFFGRKLALEL